ncbi:MAG: hypothetical protein RXR47_05700, partial [Nitrososphaeria archaeon]
MACRPDVLNHMEDRGLGMIGDLPEGARETYLSLDWTGMRYYGKYAEGLGSGDEGYPWNYATATAKMQGQDAAASSPHVRGVSEVGVVGSLIEQAPSLGFRMRTVALDSGLRSASAARYLSRFKFIS